MMLRKLRDLSDQAVIALGACYLLASIVLVYATMSALHNAGHTLLALLIMLPLGRGLGHYSVKSLRYCRPYWFKPVQGDVKQGGGFCSLCNKDIQQ